jgi:hypothetical protein
MAAQAAHLVDRILPAVPIRQFVLSFPFELSLLAATKPEVLRALARIHAEELGRHYKSAARRSGETGKLHAGAVTFVQRFGSSLNLHVHLHTCALDGVYVEDEDADAPRFVPAAAPRRAELTLLTERVALRVMTWLRRRGYTKDEDDHASNDTPDRTFAEALAQVATQRGTVENVKDDSGESEGHADPGAPPVDEAVTRHGFNLHASLTITADDDLGRERLCRYGLRPPFSLSRFRVLRDGRISYRVKKSARRTSRCRIMTPVECIARLCALVPPPRYPLTRFHGVLAPRAKLRPRIVPRLPDSVAPACQRPSPRAAQGEPRITTRERPPPRVNTGPIIPAGLPVSATALARKVDGADIPTPNVLSAKHWGRIAGGLLFAATSNVPWATLLARTFEIDVKACARCTGRLEVRAVVTDLEVARKILDAMPKAARAPPLLDSTRAFEPLFA